MHDNSYGFSWGWRSMCCRSGHRVSCLCSQDWFLLQLSDPGITCMWHLVWLSCFYRATYRTNEQREGLVKKVVLWGITSKASRHWRTEALEMSTVSMGMEQRPRHSDVFPTLGRGRRIMSSKLTWATQWIQIQLKTASKKERKEKAAGLVQWAKHLPHKRSVLSMILDLLHRASKTRCGTVSAPYHAHTQITSNSCVLQMSKPGAWWSTEQWGQKDWQQASHLQLGPTKFISSNVINIYFLKTYCGLAITDSKSTQRVQRAR